MEDKIYANAYFEALIVLKKLIKEDYNKIPKEYITFLEQNQNLNHCFEFDSSKSFAEQSMLLETKLILFFFYEEFAANERQKKIINNYKNQVLLKEENSKKNKYSIDIFENKIQKDDSKKTELIVQKQSIIQKLYFKIRKYFKEKFNI